MAGGCEQEVSIGLGPGGGEGVGLCAACPGHSGSCHHGLYSYFPLGFLQELLRLMLMVPGHRTW